MMMMVIIIIIIILQVTGKNIKNKTISVFCDSVPCKRKVTALHDTAGTEGRWRYSSNPFVTQPERGWVISTKL
jgi:hypothetical protein